MAREHNGSPKHHHNQMESKRKRLTLLFGVSGLCILFYVLGSWRASTSPVAQSHLSDGPGCASTSSSTSSSSALDFDSHHGLDINKTEEASRVRKVPECDMSWSEYTPCQHPPRGRKFEREMLKYRERHCPAKEELMMCLIPAPPNYKTPFKWPQSRDFAWYHNIPHKELSIEKAIQNWIQVEGDRYIN